MSLHITPPSSRHMKQYPRREEDPPEGDCAIYEEKGHSAADCSADQGGLTPPPQGG
jgi:hypothetical protein